MNVLLTGINGFIGRNLAYHLLRQGYGVVGIGTSKNCVVNDISAYYSGTILDNDLISKVIKNVDVIIHLAALTSHTDIVNNKFRTLEINLKGTQNILDAFNCSERAHKIIYSSTGKVYGEIKQVPITEKSPTKPLNILGKSKLITEQLIDFYSDSDKDFTIFRIFQIYGPNQQNNFLIPTILSQVDNICKKKVKIVLGDIKAKRDYVYVDDVINAFIKAIEVKNKSNLNIFNICTGQPSSAEEIVEIIAVKLGIHVDIEINKKLFRSDEMDVEYGSYKKAQNFLEWSPKFTLEQGLISTIENTC
jgi:UDP-glucose 4-epimerase